MGVEIERKFLISSDQWRDEVADSRRIAQGYLQLDPERTVRVRILDEQAFLTIKGKTQGLSRVEFEYEIPLEEGRQLLEMCTRPPIEKTRHRIKRGALVWEVDEFAGRFAGLVMAEVELATEDEQVDLPAWLGQEVSDDSSYFNSQMYASEKNNW